MKASYFWPVYDELDEVYFAHFESRSQQHVRQALGLSLASGAVLLSDGYEAYAAYAFRDLEARAGCHRQPALGERP